MPNPQHQTNPRPNQSTVGNSPVPKPPPTPMFKNFNPEVATHPRLKGNPKLVIGNTSTSAPFARKVYK